jgi:hypothetical protein
MQSLYHVKVNVCGKHDFFFDGDGNLIHWCNTGKFHFHIEDLEPLFTAIGYIIVDIEDYKDEMVFATIKKTLKTIGAKAKDFNEDED